jgi:hypothetical protein
MLEIVMLNKFCLALAGAFILLPHVALAADEANSRCVDAAVPKQLIEARNGKWIELTPNQWEFLRGIYAMNPQTPAGLPYGDRAVLARIDGDTGGVVFFIDGDKACTPMPVPDELLTMMNDVGTATINHEGSGL